MSYFLSESTHFSPDSHSFLDLVLLSHVNSLIGCIIIPALSNSDHFGRVSLLLQVILGLALCQRVNVEKFG